MSLARVVLLALLGVAVIALPAPAQTLDCLINPYLVVAVSFSTEGVLNTVAVDRGDLVKEGQELATLESLVEKATVALAAARARVESAMKSNQVRVDFGVRRFIRTDEMYKKNLVPLKELDEAETAKILAELGVLESKENRDIAELELERARAALAQRTLKSPVTGVVVERVLSPGEFLLPLLEVPLGLLDRPGGVPEGGCLCLEVLPEAIHGPAPSGETGSFVSVPHRMGACRPHPIAAWAYHSCAEPPIRT